MDQSYIVSTTEELQFNPMRREDGSEYECLAENGIGSSLKQTNHGFSHGYKFDSFKFSALFDTLRSLFDTMRRLLSVLVLPSVCSSLVLGVLNKGSVLHSSHEIGFLSGHPFGFPFGHRKSSIIKW